MTIGDILDSFSTAVQLLVFLIQTAASVIVLCAMVFLIVVFFQLAWMSVVYLLASMLSLFLGV